MPQKPQDKSFTVRRARAADARALNTYVREIYGEEGGHLITRPDEFRIGWFGHRVRLARRLATPYETCLLAIASDGQIVGQIDCWTDGRARVRHSTTLAMSVRRGWRCRGVGTALLAAFIDWVATHKTLRRIELHVHADNAHAIGLYRSFGFELEGTRRRAVQYEDGRIVDDHIMALWPKKG
ncbi:MAG: GNAT family N-acetyltransferase [Alphaproteobacteria bacterium]|nr:MAG: GNAT family N-acetyltransferase [Alphaproteobacteria bacterium]